MQCKLVKIQRKVSGHRKVSGVSKQMKIGPHIVSENNQNQAAQLEKETKSKIDLHVFTREAN